MGTIDAFQRLVWSPQFKQNCFPHRSKMGVLKSFLDSWESEGRLLVKEPLHNSVRKALQTPSSISHLENFCSHSGQIDKQSFVQGTFEELPRNPMVLRIHIVPQDHQLCERCEAVEEDLDAI